ncbi:MAG: hypothetical protein OWU84_04060 [Firmicutes bacterium]|nr:hypothetical protein [Bacillota bacterium]
MTVDESAVEAVWRLTGGHPFFVTFVIRDVVHETMQQGWNHIQGKNLEALWPQIAEHLAAERFAVDWQSEREVLVAMAQAADDAPLAQRIGRSGTALLPRLLRKGLVVRSGRGEYQLYHPLFRSYVLGRA